MPYKKGLPPEKNERVKKLYTIALAAGLTEEQSKLVVALVDHESSGTWEPAIKGDRGCSIGIAQWNKCVGNIAPKTYDEQVQKIVNEMKVKFSKLNQDQAVISHNCPILKCATANRYLNRVKNSLKEIEYL